MRITTTLSLLAFSLLACEPPAEETATPEVVTPLVGWYMVCDDADQFVDCGGALCGIYAPRAEASGYMPAFFFYGVDDAVYICDGTDCTQAFDEAAAACGDTGASRPAWGLSCVQPDALDACGGWRCDVATPTATAPALSFFGVHGEPFFCDGADCDEALDEAACE